MLIATLFGSSLRFWAVTLTTSICSDCWTCWAQAVDTAVDAAASDSANAAEGRSFMRGLSSMAVSEEP
jgi:hypothetical protein